MSLGKVTQIVEVPGIRCISLHEPTYGDELGRSSQNVSSSGFAELKYFLSPVAKCPSHQQTVRSGLSDGEILLQIYYNKISVMKNESPAWLVDLTSKLSSRTN